MLKKDHGFSVEHLSYTYPNHEKPALSDITLFVPEGQYVAILGANGSGKSTLARCIAGILDSKNSVSFSLKESEEGVSSVCMFQNPSDQIVGETVLEDACFSPENVAMEQSRMHKNVTKAVLGCDFKIDDKKPINAFSPGMKQRLLFAGIQALDSPLLILDEISSMIDPVTREKILNDLDKAHKMGKTILHITHDIFEAEKADRVIVLFDGKVVFDGQPSELNSQNMKDDRNLWRIETNDFSKILSDFANKKDSKFSENNDTNFFEKNRANSLIPAIEFSDVSFSYSKNTKQNKEQIFSNFSCSIQQGQIVALMGKTGVGKSTFLEIAGCLLQPDSGVVKILGETSFDNKTQSEKLSEIRTKIPLAIQEPDVAICKTLVGDDIAFGPKNLGYTGKTLLEKVKNSCSLVNLDFYSYRDRPVSSLSGGEKRKVGLAGVLALDSPIFLFDEPTCGLDSSSRKEVLSLFLKLKEQGKTIIFTTHRDDEVVFADKVLKLSPETNCEKKDIQTETVLNKLRKPKDKYERAKSKKNKVDYLKILSRLKNNLLPELSVTESFPAKLHPLCKYLILLLGFVNLMLADDYMEIVFALLSPCVLYFCSKLSFKRVIFAFFKMLPLAILVLLFQFIITNPFDVSTVLFKFSFFVITFKKINTSVLFILRLWGIFFLLLSISSITSRRDLVLGICYLFKPFQYLGFQVQYAGLLVLTIFRFIPQLQNETASIIKAQLARGVKLKKTNIFSLAKAFTVPVFLRCFEDADKYSEAVRSRYFGAVKERTFWTTPKWKLSDSLIVIFFVLTFFVYFI